MASEVGWYILGDNQQNISPYAASELLENLKNGYLSESTLVWAEGRADWQPLSSVPELMLPLSDNRDGSQNPAVLNSEEEFEKWQREVRESEAVGLNNGSQSVWFLK